MNRRSALGSIAALAGTGLAGCVGFTDGEPDGNPGEAGSGGSGESGGSGTAESRPPGSYDRCPRLVIRVEELSEPARREVETTLEGGSYGTDDELYLPHLLDPDRSYLADGDVHYRARIEEEGATKRVALEGAIPNKGDHELTVENRNDDPVSVDVLVAYLPEEADLLSVSASIGPGERGAVGSFDRKLGEYRAEVGAGEAAETFTWREEEHVDPLDTVVVDGGDVYPEPRAVAELIQCRDVWEE